LACLVVTSVQKSRIRSIAVTNTLCAIPRNSVPIVTGFTAFTTEASGIIHTSEAPPSKPVTVADISWVDVVITRAWLTAAAWDEWVAIVTVIAFFALFSSVTLFTSVTY